MEATRVIAVRGLRREDLLADPSFVYVGRSVPRSGWSASIWGNPFRVAKQPFRVMRTSDVATAEEAVEKYRRWLKRAVEINPRQYNLATLRGKVLGCWCCDWNPGEPVVRPCHAIILAQFVDHPDPNNDEDDDE